MMVIEWPWWAMYLTLGFLSAAAEAYVDAILPTHLDMRLVLGLFLAVEDFQCPGNAVLIPTT